MAQTQPQTAKKVTEMSREEYKTARGKLVKADGTTWQMLATAIRAMSDAEIAAFQEAYSIAIVPDTRNLKPYSKMTPGEKEIFHRTHGIGPGDMAA